MSTTTILVIDDLQERGRALAGQLSAAGLQAFQADSPRAGYALFKQRRPELVFISLQTRDLEALEALIYLVGGDARTIYHTSENFWPFHITFPEKRPVIVSTQSLQKAVSKLASTSDREAEKTSGGNRFLRPLIKEMKDAPTKHSVL